MMSVSPLRTEDLYGLFELDNLGTVLYSRHEQAGKRDGRPDMAGRNFYDDIVPFENVDEFRRCITEFTLGTKVADSFNFNCMYEGLSQPVKVLLARIRERVNHENTKSVLVHLRRTE